MRQHGASLREHPRLDCRYGTFCEYDEREIVRRVVDELDQFRNFHSCESTEQQTDHGRECQFGAHDAPEMSAHVYIIERHQRKFQVDKR